MNLIDYNNILHENGHVESLISPQEKSEYGKITAELVNSDEGFDVLEKEWNALAELSDSHVFQTFDWQRLWWKHFGQNYRLHLIVFRKQDSLVGIAPFYIEKTSLFLNLSFLNLRLIGSSYTSKRSVALFNGCPSDYLDIIVNPEFEDEVASLLIQYLEKCGDLFNQVAFDEISTESFLMRKMIPAMENNRWSVKKTRIDSYRENAAESVEEYLIDLSAKTNEDFRYSMHVVTEKRLFRINHNESKKTITKLYDEFVKLHQKRWNSLGKPGLFADQNFKNFLHDITERFYKNGWLRIKIAAIEKKILAVDYAFLYNNRLYDYQKAFDDLAPFSGLGTEKSFFHCIIEDMVQDGCVVYDLVRCDGLFGNQTPKRANYNWKVIIPDPDHKKGAINKWYGLNCWIHNKFLRLNKEVLMLKIHIKEFGLTGFVPKYYKWKYQKLKREIN